MTPHAHSEEDYYIESVIDHIPPAQMLRSQIALDLRSHIAERIEHGQSIDDVVRQLGDPAALAESYLGAVPMVAGTFWERVEAKLIDFALFTLAALAIAAATVGIVILLDGKADIAPLAAPLAGILSSLLFVIYTVVAEHRSGQTIGKRLLGLQAVRESGARISLGQAVVRQLPLLLQIFVIDALFALFTDKSQRAFELISKTRVVHVPPSGDSR